MDLKKKIYEFDTNMYNSVCETNNGYMITFHLMLIIYIYLSSNHKQLNVITN